MIQDLKNLIQIYQGIKHFLMHLLYWLNFEVTMNFDYICLSLGSIEGGPMPGRSSNKQAKNLS